uniref:Uncharacterized protein n=1 Tax=Oryza sativa subsp. japonica TaxID=39947 RepID=Q84QT6_ORYSJ|nr:hypothetical protein [Oryza sativa Japonica Group]
MASGLGWLPTPTRIGSRRPNPARQPPADGGAAVAAVVVDGDGGGRRMVDGDGGGRRMVAACGGGGNGGSGGELGVGGAPRRRRWRPRAASAAFHTATSVAGGGEQGGSDEIVGAAERHNELSLKNAQQRPPGSAPLPEVHFNVQNNAENKKGFKGNSSNNPKNLTGKQTQQQQAQIQGSKERKREGCGSNTHVAKDRRIPKHLVLLYQKSLKDKKSSENPRFEAHFNLTNKERPEVASSHQAPIETESNLNVLPEDVAPLSVMDDMFIEYCSMDPLEDLQ